MTAKKKKREFLTKRYYERLAESTESGLKAQQEDRQRRAEKAAAEPKPVPKKKRSHVK